MARVMFLTRWYPSESKPFKGLFVREHARAASLDNEVTVLHLAGPSDALDQWWRFEEVNDPALTLGVRTFRVWYRQTQLPVLNYVMFLLSGLRALRRVKGFLKGWDVIHAHEFDAAMVAVLDSRSRIPVLATEHSSHFARRILKRRAIWRARFAFERCDAVLPVSHALALSLLEHGIKARFVVVPNCVDLMLFQPVSNIALDQRPRDAIKRVTVVSRLTDVKGIPTLIEACSKLARVRLDWHIDVIGDGPNRSIYEERVKALGLEDQVQFRGLQTRAEVAWYLQNADLHVVPSTRETFCVAAVEALACGTPVVATRSGGPEEIVNSEVGLVIEPANPGELASAIGEGLNASFASRESISRYARERFSHEVVGAMLSKLYREAVTMSSLRMTRTGAK